MWSPHSFNGTWALPSGEWDKYSRSLIFQTRAIQQGYIPYPFLEELTDFIACKGRNSMNRTKLLSSVALGMQNTPPLPLLLFQTGLSRFIAALHWSSIWMNWVFSLYIGLCPSLMGSLQSAIPEFQKVYQTNQNWMKEHIKIGKNAKFQQDWSIRLWYGMRASASLTVIFWFSKACHSVSDGPLLLKLGILTNFDMHFIVRHSIWLNLLELRNG